MNDSERLVGALKRLLRKQGITYRGVAVSLGISEPSVKRMFSRGTFTLDRLAHIAGLLGMTLAEVTHAAEHDLPRLRTLTEAQEKELVTDPVLLLVAACVINNWTPQEITGTYRLTHAECLKRLLRLDRLGLVTLLPGDRVRLNVARDFDWLAEGPIQRFFRKQQNDDFLAGDFTGEGENLFFLYGMLAPAARTRLQAQLRKLRDEFSELHRESVRAPFAERSSVCLLLAQRPWEPRLFAALRRKGAVESGKGGLVK